MPLYGNETLLQNVTTFFDMFTVANTISGGVLFPLMLLTLFVIISVNLRNYGFLYSAFAGMVVVFIISTIIGVPYKLLSPEMWNVVAIITAILGFLIIVNRG